MGRAMSTSATRPDATRGEFCMKFGAAGYINRKEFTHWGIPPHWTDNEGQSAWSKVSRPVSRSSDA